MESALLRASTTLQRGPSHKYTDQLARRVMTLFDQGLRDDEVIASTAVYQETLIEKIGAIRTRRPS